MIINVAIDTKSNAFEPPESTDYDKCDDSKNDSLGTLRQIASREDEVVENVREHDDREIQGRKLQQTVKPIARGVGEGGRT